LATCTVEVRSRVVGQTAADLDPVLLELVEEQITVSELIRRTVEEQVRDLLTRRRLEAPEVQAALNQQYLTTQEVAEQSQAGKVSLHAPAERNVPSRIDTPAEVAKALRAFEAGRFFIFADGRQVEGLDEVLSFEQQASVTFLRLMPLVGG